MTCLKRAKSLGLLQSTSTAKTSATKWRRCQPYTDEMWNNVVPIAVLRQALCHQDDQVILV